MSYGLKYQTQFTSQTDDNTPAVDYVLEFLFKDYSGDVTSLVGGETTAVQSSATDDPFAPVKGQSLTINLVNFGNIPLTAFYSDEEDGIKVLLRDTANNVKFVGYLVQEDSYETLVDFTHQITLSANDSLGLLKGVPLNEPSIRRKFSPTTYRTNGANDVVYVRQDSYNFYPEAGNTIEFDGIEYTIVSAVNETTFIGIVVYNWTITVSPATPGIPHTIGDVYLTGPVNLLRKNDLLTMVAVCLSNTNLGLITNIFANVTCNPQDTTRSHFEQTLIDSQTFLNGEEFADCYDVLEKIMRTFRCSIFQANGEWNIVRWEEMRFYTGAAIPCYVYDELFSYVGAGTFTNIFGIGATNITKPVYPLSGGSFRPYKFVRKQFNYQQPKYLLRNYDLTKLGPLLRQYVSGSNTIYEYTATDWQGYVGSTKSERFIRITKDSTDTELERVLVVRGTSSDTIRSVGSATIEASAGDKIRVTFSTKTNISQPGPVGLVFAVKLTNGTTDRYVDELPDGNGAWISTVGFNYSIASGDNTNEWHTVEIASSQMPFDGLLTVYLAQNTATPQSTSKETLYKDIRFEYIPFINDTTKIIGHVHKQIVSQNIKNNVDDTITIDDSPRNAIAGTLFLDSVTGLLQDRTLNWKHISNPSSVYNRLGELMTQEEQRWRMRLRSKMEGEFIGIMQNNTPVSLLTIAVPDWRLDKRYVPGLLTIDYKQNRFNGTLWEIWETTEPDLSADYSYTYLYSTT